MISITENDKIIKNINSNDINKGNNINDNKHINDNK